MTRDAVIGSDLDQLGHERGALSHGVRTAGVETAAGWWPRRARQLAAERRVRRRALELGIGHRHRRRAAPACRGAAAARTQPRPGRVSTILPRYITATRSAIWRTTRRSWEMKR